MKSIGIRWPMQMQYRCIWCLAIGTGVRSQPSCAYHDIQASRTSMRQALLVELRRQEEMNRRLAGIKMKLEVLQLGEGLVADTLQAFHRVFHCRVHRLPWSHSPRSQHLQSAWHSALAASQLVDGGAGTSEQMLPNCMHHGKRSCMPST